MATSKQARAAGESALFLVVLAGILVLLNVLGVFVHGRADTTGKELFSLSDGSKRLASSLEDQMEIRAYFSADLPPPHNSTERYVRDLLAEYQDASKGQINVRFINPDDDEKKADAERDGITKVQDQKLESDSFSVQEGYRGVSFHYLGETKTLARVDTTAGLEYSITQSIKELTGEQIKIAVLSGHESPTLEKGLSSLKQYLPTYDMVEVAADKEIDLEHKALLIIHPETALSETELQYINQYAMRGGSVGVFGGGIKISQNQGDPTGSPVDPGLNALLQKWGVKIESKLVADAQCGRARLPTRLGIPIAVPYPPVPIVTFTDEQRDHPANFRLDQVGMPYPVALSLTDALKGDGEVTRKVLANSTKASWLMEGETLDLASKQRWSVTAYDGPHTLAVALEGKLPSAFADQAVTSAPGTDGAPGAAVQAPARAEQSIHVLVMGSGYFLRDEFLPPPAPNSVNLSGGIAFALNAIDWLAQESDLIAIRAKNVEDPTLEVPANVKEAELTIREAIKEEDEDKARAAFEERQEAMVAWDKKKQVYRWGNTLAIPVAFALLGVVRWRARRRRRSQLKL